MASALFGASLARAFKLYGLGDVGIYDHATLHLNQAKELALGTHYFDSPQELAKHADIIFVCVPVDHIVGVIRDIVPYLKDGAIITDVGSVKSAISKDVQSFLPKRIAFVPGHPIAGTEHSGPKAGQADLFAGKTYVLVESAENAQATTKIAGLLQTIGANIAYLDADKHDLMLGFTSHLSHICAFAAMACSEKVSGRAHENVMRFAGGSFRDLTRVAASGPDMWTGIFMGNQQHILEAYKLFRAEMDQLASLIEKGDADGVHTYIGHAAELRRQHDKDKGGT